MISLDIKSEVVRLRGLDYSYDKITNILGISKPKVMGICSEFEAEINDARQEELDTALRDFSYATEERSSIYRQLIGKLHTEIITRDISQVATEKLFTMLERTERSLSTIEQRKGDRADDPFAKMSDQTLIRIIDERRTSPEN